MKRSGRLQRKKPLQSKKGLKPGKGLNRSSKLRPGKRLGSNPERKAARRERDFGEWRDRVVRMPCWWCGLQPRDGCAPAHAKTRATGHDLRALLPMCPSLPGRQGCHDLYDAHKLPPARQVAHQYTSHDAALATAHALYEEHHG